MESKDSDNSGFDIFKFIEYIITTTQSHFYKGLCPCGFFCKECLRMAIAERGWKAGLSEHIQCHTLIGGKIFMWQILRYGCMSGSEEWNTRKKDKNICISVWKSPV